MLGDLEKEDCYQRTERSVSPLHVNTWQVKVHHCEHSRVSTTCSTVEINPNATTAIVERPPGESTPRERKLTTARKNEVSPTDNRNRITMSVVIIT